MKPNDTRARKSEVLHYLSHLPKKILSLEGSENTPAFVLHELCNENCFNLSKAAFFVDSPDFDYLKGIAGFSAPEAYKNNDTMWQDPHSFISHMQQASFNQKVRNFSQASIKRSEVTDDELLHNIAREFDFHNPGFHKWDMKHDNHGFLIYESNGAALQGVEEQLENSLYLLSFCPIF